ncbi:NADH pyrophosphatase [Corynebacterium occultum]|uniref:NAD(+) diphosphatase n=1 Tax=Corynebacterium occultum TaxID=2675219 RepID=A0A6B8VU76_9CORY|nr:NUDIX domain-containing protein [Corynebacterium occultum]QGU06659.1 NADH pyrophosphatase [Corynebacterium occultum]
MSGYLCLDARNRYVLTGGAPLLVSRPHGGEAVRIDAETWAVRVGPGFIDHQAEEFGGEIADGLEFIGNPKLARAAAILRHRDNFRFDPADGTPLTYDEDGVVARGGATKLLFPRIDPAVIGIVELAGENQILLGRNVHHDFFSLIAGYVDPGESLEQAFAREVMEETGRRAEKIQYWGSQPWPPSGSLMIGFHATTTDIEATAPTDGELAEIIWAGPSDIAKLPLPSAGSIAHHMITDWLGRH